MGESFTDALFYLPFFRLTDVNWTSHPLGIEKKRPTKVNFSWFHLLIHTYTCEGKKHALLVELGKINYPHKRFADLVSERVPCGIQTVFLVEFTRSKQKEPDERWLELLLLLCLMYESGNQWDAVCESRIIISGVKVWQDSQEEQILGERHFACWSSERKGKMLMLRNGFPIWW